MVTDFAFKLLVFGLEFSDYMLLLEHLEEVLGIVEIGQVLNSLVDVGLENLQLVQGLVREVLWRWSIVLHTLKVGNDLSCVGLLFINDLLEHVKLVVHLHGDLIFQALLVEDSLLHVRALTQVIGTQRLDLLQEIDLFGARLLQGQGGTPLVLFLEVAVVAEGGVVGH